MKNKNLYSVLLLMLNIAAYGQNPVQKRLDSIMQLAHTRGIFNGNVLVAQNGRIVYERSFGYADGSKTKLLTSAYKFDIGSVSKEFNGAAILLLKQRGELSLDDPISKFLTDLPEWSAKVKIRHLLTYTSGIPTYDPISSEGDSVILANLKQLKSLKFEPGTAYLYNHYNVYLQMRIVEKVSGQSYAGFLNSNIFKPCGMNGAVVDLPVSSPDIAKAFDQDFHPTPYFQTVSGWVRLTAKDLYLWSECLHQNKILNKSSFAELAAGFPNGESSIGTTGFSGDTLSWHRHQGSNSNYEALLYSDLKQGLTVVMMTNNQQMKVDGIKNALFAALSKEPATVPKKSFYLEIREKTLANVDQGLKYYQELKANQQDTYDFSFEIGDLISTGKYLLRRNKFDDAIKVFQTAVALKAKPADIAYSYELMGECYLKKGDKTNAQINYRQALTLNPNNKNAAGMLQQIDKS
ncbi:serine hydrolase [Mucilaginibacter dorajii]|nr:serine hydrolase [Mucilaginibacter dorajii]MCS3736292.1 CubicO group peptidase (beta-lactamase class C family) [Mucilaginibacter dorajii]